MATVRQRIGTGVQWNALNTQGRTLADGEIGVVSDATSQYVKIGNGGFVLASRPPVDPKPYIQGQIDTVFEPLTPYLASLPAPVTITNTVSVLPLWTAPVVPYSELVVGKSVLQLRCSGYMSAAASSGTMSIRLTWGSATVTTPSILASQTSAVPRYDWSMTADIFFDTATTFSILGEMVYISSTTGGISSKTLQTIDSVIPVGTPLTSGFPLVVRGLMATALPENSITLREASMAQVA